MAEETNKKNVNWSTVGKIVIAVLTILIGGDKLTKN